MYCRNCGKTIADGSNYCNHCGVFQGASYTNQKISPPNNRKTSSSSGTAGKRNNVSGIIGAILLFLAAANLFKGFFGNGYREMLTMGMDVSDITVVSLTAICLLVGSLLVFDLMIEDLTWPAIIAVVIIVLMVKASGPDGKASEILPVSENTKQQQVQENSGYNSYSGYIPSSWASENRKLANGGNCGIMEMDSPVRNCTSVDFILSAEGNYGATTKGNWEVHFRIGGQWQHIQTVYYEGVGEQTFNIRFKNATTFDAVSAFPTQRGNYSYISTYYLSNPMF